MVQKRNEIRNGPLEVNVVLPQRVIGIDEQGLWADRIGTLLHGNMVVMLLLIRGK
jgi:hypothetical protein